MDNDAKGPDPAAPLEASDTERSAFRKRVKKRRAGIEHQMQVTRAQIDQANERIEARTGRNLIMAILIGVGLGSLLVLSLVFIKALFMVFAGLLIAFTVFEFASALRRAGRDIPRIPTVVTALAVVPCTYYLGATGLWYSVLAGIVFVSLWRVVEYSIPALRGHSTSLWRDIAAGAFVQVYVTFLASFSVLLAAQNNGGQWWVLAFLILVVSIDTGAYASGLNFGKHAMAPLISPKKTWEGFAGGVVAAMIAGILLALFMLDQPWWVGVIFAATMVFTATLGDLAESLIKRDLGIKDMSSWLPGHGGLLDRMDSILPSAAAAFVLFVIFV